MREGTCNDTDAFRSFRELDRLSEQVMGSRVPRTMPMEAWRTKDEFSVYVDLPGVDRDDVELTVERNVVSIPGGTTARA